MIAPACDLRAAHLDDVLVRFHAELVVDANRRDHDPEIAGDLAADHADAAQQRAASRGAGVDERHEAEADRELQRVDTDLGHRLVAGFRQRRLGGFARGDVGVGGAGQAFAHGPGGAPKAAAISRNGSFGRPGISANRPIAQAPTSGALRWPRICVAMSEPRSRSEAARVTMMPAATEINSAGICAARPSPTVSSE